MNLPLSSPEPVAEQQAAILAAAVEILRSHGPTALTVRKVAAAAGYSTSGVYTWFGGKQGLVEAIFIGGFESFDAALAELDEGDDIDWMVDRAVTYRRWAMAHPTEYQVMFARVVPEHQPSEAALDRGRQSFDAHLAAVRRVQATGHLAPMNPTALAYHLWATLHGHVMLELSGMAIEVDEEEGGREQRYADNVRRTLLGFAPGRTAT